jgi:phosphoribosylaminoimidazolecarboxamide formyltransferase/IMP cyclohydrolase
MRALISVSDKTGLVSFAEALVKFGYELVSTGGTFSTLKQHKIKVTPIEEVTDFPEILDGRLKTLHPKVHGGLLALRDNDEHQAICQEYGIQYIDLVVVNLYPFEQTIAKKSVKLDEAIENIDIGGPTMIRSAAKNHAHVGVVVNPDDYATCIEEMKNNAGSLTLETRKRLAVQAFKYTSKYDTIIANYLSKELLKKNETSFPATLSLNLYKAQELRYGENPHQSAAYYKLSEFYKHNVFEQLHGKELSYNNYIDIQAAWMIAREMDIPGAVIIKHTNPCGAAIDNSLVLAYEKAYAADPVSAFGSIVSLNRQLDIETATKISETFVEVVLAPDFDQKALALLMKKPALRLIKIKDFFELTDGYEYRLMPDGFLVQDRNDYKVKITDLKWVTKEKPNTKITNDLLFGFSMVKHVKSNAILIAKEGQVLGVGAGQMSRVDAVKIALEKAGEKAKNAILASDAFFPFKDSIELAAKAGIKAVIQPGGSKRDAESVAACNAHGIAMACTGIRHFKH